MGFHFDLGGEGGSAGSKKHLAFYRKSQVSQALSCSHVFMTSISSDVIAASSLVHYVLLQYLLYEREDSFHLGWRLGSSEPGTRSQLRDVFKTVCQLPSTLLMSKHSPLAAKLTRRQAKRGRQSRTKGLGNGQTEQGEIQRRLNEGKFKPWQHLRGVG